MPKMKTHHWAGVTLSMKNLFGVMPGVYYGWPKNVLHHVGHPRVDPRHQRRGSPAPGDRRRHHRHGGRRPDHGHPKAAGVLVMGTNLPAVDATCARIMGLDPWRIAYLAGASGRLGPIAEPHIAQRGERLGSLIQPFQLLDDPSMAAFRAGSRH